MEAPPLERKLVAILAADVEGYSRLMHDDEEATLATLSSHRRIIDDLIAAGRGQISGTAGDSVLAEFASVVDAVNCAVAVQQGLVRANAVLPPDRQMQLRIGINVGDVMIKDGDIFGDGVNVAARLEGLAEPGGICVTRGVRDYVRDRVDCGFEDLGEHLVKNISRPVRTFRVIFDPNGSAELAPSSRATSSGPSLVATGPDRVLGSDAEVAFWTSVQETGDRREYEAYLQRYPDGAFAPLARMRLESTEPPPPRSTEDHSVELAFWDTVKDSDNAAMFEAYLRKFPDGEFKSLAEIRLADLASS